MSRLIEYLQKAMDEALQIEESGNLGLPKEYKKSPGPFTGIRINYPEEHECWYKLMYSYKDAISALDFRCDCSKRDSLPILEADAMFNAMRYLTPENLEAAADLCDQDWGGLSMLAAISLRAAAKALRRGTEPDGGTCYV